MNNHLFRVALILLLISGFVLESNSQSSNLENLSSVNIDELTDDQIQQIADQLEASGYSEQQLELLGRARGMSPDQISKLRNRVSQLKMSTGTSSATGDERLRTIADYNQYSSQQIMDPLLSTLKRDTGRTYDLPIAGLAFFRNSRLSFEPSVNVPTPENYLVGPGDELIIDVWGDSEETYNLIISPEGSIRIANLGLVYLNGLTVQEVKNKLINSLKRIYSTIGRGTTVEVSLGQLRTITVNVIGAVEVPGTYNMSSFSTAFTALYLAGGPRVDGSLRRIEVFRKGKQVGILDAYDYFIRGNQNSNVDLQDQDVVLVRPYVNRVWVYGEVKSPAIYELLPGETLEDLFLFNGGFTERAFSKNISIQRNAENYKTVVTVDAGNFNQVDLRSGDILRVPRISNQFRNRVTIEGAVNNPGEFQFVPNMKLSDLVGWADGFRQDAFMDRAVIIRQNEDLTLTSLTFNPKLLSDHDLNLQEGDYVRIQSIFDLHENYTITIQGEVQSPGVFQYAQGMTVENLIYLAGGFKEGAAKSFVEVARRINEESENKDLAAEIFNFTIDSDLGISDSASTFQLRPFDLVVVRKSPHYEAQISIAIEGEVEFPGKYVLASKEERISDVIERSGGLTKYAYSEGATLIRRTEFYPDGNRVTPESAEIRRSELEEQFERDSSLSQLDSRFRSQETVGIELDEIMKSPKSKYDIILQDGDILSIPRELQTVRIRGEVLYPNAIRYDQGYNFKEFISNAGGFTSEARKNRSYVIYPNGKAKRTRSFLGFKNFPKVLPGSEIIIPRKPDKQPLPPQAWIAMASSVATLALVVQQLIRP